jgi:hypothetical protein
MGLLPSYCMYLSWLPGVNELGMCQVANKVFRRIPATGDTVLTQYLLTSDYTKCVCIVSKPLENPSKQSSFEEHGDVTGCALLHLPGWPLQPARPTKLVPTSVRLAFLECFENPHRSFDRTLRRTSMYKSGNVGGSQPNIRSPFLPYHDLPKYK